MTGAYPLSQVQRANRRRLGVFLSVLVLALASSLAYTFMRPAEYRATARIEITPSSGPPTSVPAAAPAGESPKSFLTEVQALTSRPLLESVARDLARAGYEVSPLGSDPVSTLQERLEARPVSGTNVVELVASGPSARMLAPLLNGIVDGYRTRLAKEFQASTTEAMAQADDEVRKLETNVAAKRRDVESFRMRNNIVSLEREENEILSRVKNLGTSLRAANERVATAEGKVRSMTEAASQGRAVVRSRDDPTLASMELRASLAREELRNLERSYTPDYMALDPKVKEMRIRLAELERQIVAQREVSGRTALNEAQEELASAQEAARRTEAQIAGGQQEARQFAARYNEYKSRQEDLAQLENVYRDAAQRRARLEASERARTPTLKVLEAAATPQQPWRPLYWRDAALSVAGSVLLALLCMWLVELFNRPEPPPPLVVAQHLGGGMLSRAPVDSLPSQGPPAAALESLRPALLPQPAALPRELTVGETSELLNAADDECRLAILLLLSGVSPDEALRARCADIDLQHHLLHVRGDPERAIELPELLCRRLAVRGAAHSRYVLGPGEHALSREDLDAQVLCAAHDAGIERAAEVTAEILRHTHVAFLVRQGIRFADLMRIVGRLPAETLGAYSPLAPQGSRVSAAAIKRVHPAALVS